MALPQLTRRQWVRCCSVAFLQGALISVLGLACIVGLGLAMDVKVPANDDCCGPSGANPEACLDLYVGPAEEYQSEEQDAYVDAMSQTPPDLEAAAEAGSNLEQIGAYLDGLGGSCGSYDDTEWNSGADLLELCLDGETTYKKCQEERSRRDGESVLILGPVAE